MVPVLLGNPAPMEYGTWKNIYRLASRSLIRFWRRPSFVVLKWTWRKLQMSDFDIDQSLLPESFLKDHFGARNWIVQYVIDVLPIIVPSLLIYHGFFIALFTTMVDFSCMHQVASFLLILLGMSWSTMKFIFILASCFFFCNVYA